MTRSRGACGVLLSVGLLGAALGACGEEGPTSVGAGLVPGGAIRTIEVTIEPERYLVWDTAFAGFGSPGEAPFTIIANEFGGELNANTLVRFGILPRAVAAPDTAGVGRVDTIPELLRVRLIVRIDTLTSAAAGPVTLRLFRSAEDWDRLTATWAMRVDTPGARVAWQSPGGTRGPELAEVDWALGQDSVVFEITDTLAIHPWREEAELRQGAIIVAEGAEARLRARSIGIQLDYQPSFRPDTVITLTEESREFTYIFEPELAREAGAVRVGGVPAWRGMLRLRERLDTLNVPCPDRPNCFVPLREVAITRAALSLQRTASPPGFAPEDSMFFVARHLLFTDRLPLMRTPLGEVVGVTASAVPPDSMDVGETLIPITDLMRLLVLPPDTTPGARPPPYLALLPITEGATFGFASFAAAPRLRLVLTVATETQLR
jgi:hypothetical protein